MKTRALLFLAISFVSLQSMAADRVCFGFKSDSQTAGSRITVNIAENSVIVTNGDDWNGTYPRSKSASLHGKDGRTYLNFDVDGSDGCDTLLVDQDLLQSSGQGSVKFRCRGEGFEESKFFCPNR